MFPNKSLAKRTLSEEEKFTLILCLVLGTILTLMILHNFRRRLLDCCILKCGCGGEERRQQALERKLKEFEEAPKVIINGEVKARSWWR